MRVLLIRHAIAAERDSWHGQENERPLTDEGRQRFRRGARALARLVPELELIATSPLRRCLETAEILAAAWTPSRRIELEPALAPGGATLQLVERRIDARSPATLALVGHEPDLSSLLARLLLGDDRSFTSFKKGSAALIELASEPAVGVRSRSTRLHWHLTAAQLRDLE